MGFKYEKTEIVSKTFHYQQYKKGYFSISFSTITDTPETQYEITLTEEKQPYAILSILK